MKQIHPGHPGSFANAIRAQCSFLKQRKKEPKNAFRRLKLNPPWSRTISRHSSRENRQQPTCYSRRPTTASNSSPQAILWTNARSKTNPGPGTSVLTISASNVEQQAASANTSSPGKPEFELASSSNINSGARPSFPADCNCQVPLSFPAPQKTFAISDPFREEQTV